MKSSSLTPFSSPLSSPLSSPSRKPDPAPKPNTPTPGAGPSTHPGAGIGRRLEYSVRSGKKRNAAEANLPAPDARGKRLRGDDIKKLAASADHEAGYPEIPLHDHVMDVFSALPNGYRKPSFLYALLPHAGNMVEGTAKEFIQDFAPETDSARINRLQNYFS